jgi:hypothetical protein
MITDKDVIIAGAYLATTNIVADLLPRYRAAAPDGSF